MPNYDLRPKVDQRPDDGQLYHSEGLTPEMWYDCTLEALRETARDLGRPETPDDHQLREAGAPGTSQGLGWEASIAAAAKLYPGLERQMAIESPADIVASLIAHISKGHIVHIGFYCDSAANVPPVGPISYSHAERLLALNTDAGNATFGNVEPHPTYTLTFAQIRSLYDQGGILVFTPEEPVHPELKRVIAELIGLVVENGEWPTAAQVDSWTGYIADDGSGVENLIDTMVQGRVAAGKPATFLTELAARAAVPGPKGDPGQPGPEGPQGPAGPAGPTTTVTVAPSTSPGDQSWGALLAELLRRILGRS